MTDDLFRSIPAVLRSREAERVVTLEHASQFLTYDPELGLFKRIKSKLSYVLNGPVGYVKGGYLIVRVSGYQFRAHRLAFLFMTGKFPDLLVDHINGNGLDNRWENLRNATHLINAQNVRHRRNKQVPFLGVSVNHKDFTRFKARVRVNGKEVALGTFGTAIEAHQAYLAAKRQMHAGCTI